MLVEGSEAGVESELSLTERAVKVEKSEVVFVGGVKDFVELVVGMATGVAVMLTKVEVSGKEMVGLEKRDVDDGMTSVIVALILLLAFPHSASTSAMMSPPPVIESKVRREEMSASKQLRLVSPGTKGGSEASKGGTCSLVLLTLPAVILGVTVSDGVVAVLSCDVKLVMGSPLSVSGLSSERGWGLGVRVRSSLMISTLLARDDMRSGLGGASSLSSLSFDRNLTLPKRPFRPRRCRPTGWDTVWTRRSPAPLRPPLSNDRKLRDLAELAEEMEVRAWEAARTPSSPSVSSACSISP